MIRWSMDLHPVKPWYTKGLSLSSVWTNQWPRLQDYNLILLTSRVSWSTYLSRLSITVASLCCLILLLATILWQMKGQTIGEQTWRANKRF